MVKEKSVIKIIGLHPALQKAEPPMSFHCLIQTRVKSGEGVLGKCLGFDPWYCDGISLDP